MESPVKLLQELRRRVQSVTYGSPIYRLMLDQGPMPDRLRMLLPDPWPGDPVAAEKLIAGADGLFKNEQKSEARSFGLVGETHEGLRDLKALGTDIARRKAASLIQDWLEQQDQWNGDDWSPFVLGTRLSNWIAFYDFYGEALSPDLSKKWITGAVRQLRHLQYTAQVTLMEMEGLMAVKGLIYGGLCLIDREKSLGLALDLLKRQLETEILPDGGHVSRDPFLQAQILSVLIDIRTALCAAKLEVPPELTLSIARMVPALKMMRHADGGLALFNGSFVGRPELIDATLSLAQVKGRALKRLPHAAYERLTAARSLLLVDVGLPANRPYDRRAHAGLMSFEFSVGRERIITNCGAGLSSHLEWSSAMAATAAHSTITVEDTNACEVLPDGGGIGHRPSMLHAQRYEQDGFQFVEMAHDGYWARHKCKLHRSLALAQSGDELKGRDLIMAPSGRDYSIRWHIHPEVTASLAHDASSVLLRTASGAGWRFRISSGGGASLALESSVTCADGTPRRTLQMQVSGRTGGDPAIVEWTLTRESNKKGS